MPTLTYTVAFHHLGIAGSPAELGVDNTNTWHVPVDAHGDAFPSLEEYFAHPLATKGGFRGIPAFITFPGMHRTLDGVALTGAMEFFSYLCDA
jgi:hypothetical protein